LKVQNVRMNNGRAERWTWASGDVPFALGLLGIFVTIVCVARLNLYTFPLPNEDDARFFFPAWTLAVHGSLRVPLLNAPNGMFWVPDGFYVWLALFFRVFRPSMEVAHGVCQVTIAAGAALLVTAFSLLCGSRGFALLCGLLLISPGVIFAANTVRMEPLILLLFAIGLLLHTFERRLGAAAVFLLGVVVHPALLLGACFYAISILVADFVLPSTMSPRNTAPDRRHKPTGALLLNVLIVSAVGAAIALEALHVLHHLATFHQHMAYQVARKADRHPMQLLKSRRGLLLVVELLFTSGAAWITCMRSQAWLVFRRQLLPVFLVSLGLSAYATFGREIPYNVYSYGVVPATFFCLASRVLNLLAANKIIQDAAPALAA
jgi:hypothetical protein